MLLGNSGIEQSQKVSVLAAAAPSSDFLSDYFTNYEFLKSVTYNQVSSVVKKCDKSSAPNCGSNLNTNAATTGHLNIENGNQNNSRNTGLKKASCFFVLEANFVTSAKNLDTGETVRMLTDLCSTVCSPLRLQENLSLHSELKKVQIRVKQALSLAQKTTSLLPMLVDCEHLSDKWKWYN